MAQKQSEVLRRRPPGKKKKNKCISTFEQLIACEFDVTFEVSIPDVELVNINCVND